MARSAAPRSVQHGHKELARSRRHTSGRQPAWGLMVGGRLMERLASVKHYFLLDQASATPRLCRFPPVLSLPPPSLHSGRLLRPLPRLRRGGARQARRSDRPGRLQSAGLSLRQVCGAAATTSTSTTSTTLHLHLTLRHLRRAAVADAFKDALGCGSRHTTSPTAAPGDPRRAAAGGAAAAGRRPHARPRRLHLRLQGRVAALARPLKEFNHQVLPAPLPPPPSRDPPSHRPHPHPSTPRYQLIFAIFCKHVERQLSSSWLSQQATKALAMAGASLAASGCSTSYTTSSTT